MLTGTWPKTPAEEAVLKRAKLLTDIRWTPIAAVPAYIKSEECHTVIPAGEKVYFQNSYGIWTHPMTRI